MRPAQSTSRRHLLAGLVLAPAALLAPSPALAVDGGPDAAIIALGERHATLSREAAAIWTQAAAADLRAEAERPAAPEALAERPGDFAPRAIGCAGDWWRSRVGLGQQYGAEDVARWRRALDQEGPLSFAALNPKAAARGREVLAAWSAHRDALEAVNVSHGVRRLEREADELDRERYAIERAIFDAMATTPAGWRIKARIAAEILGAEPDGTYEDQLVRSLLADLVAAPAP